MEKSARQLYAELGVVPVINAIGNMTMLGGSSPSPQVLEAMQRAGRYYVDMDELLIGAGRLSADLLNCQAALVTAGCSAALLQGVAACMTGNDPEKMGRLPATDGMQHEVVMQRAQRYKYDRVVRMAGVRIVDAGTSNGTTPEQLAAGIWIEAEGNALHFNMLTVHDGDEAIIAARLKERLGSG